MRLGVYAALDRKAGAYGGPLVFANDDMAKRAMAEVALRGDRNLDMVKYADDFDMYHVGYFDDVTGIVTPADVRLVARFSDFGGDQVGGENGR